jgi:hypothetical protein
MVASSPCAEVSVALRIAHVTWLFVIVSALGLLTPHRDAEASHAQNANTVSKHSSLYRWYGIVGYVRGATGGIANPNQAAVVALVSSDSCVLNCSGQTQWAQVGVYRGTGGYPSGSSCPVAQCIRNTSSTPRIYTEHQVVTGCGAVTYSIYDHGNQPSSTNHAYWSYWNGVTTGPDPCGAYNHQFRLAKTYSNGLPQVLRTVSIFGAGPEVYASAALEVHNRGTEQNSGLNCFGASYSSGACSASTTNGLTLYAAAYGWLRWQNSLDPTDGAYYGFNGQGSSFGCSGSQVPYKYEVISSAFWWSTKGFYNC